jgi:hypothetical protein
LREISEERAQSSYCRIHRLSSHNQLDDQDIADRYRGQNVKVIGTIHPRSNMLHIIDIVADPGGKD